MKKISTGGIIAIIIGVVVAFSVSATEMEQEPSPPVTQQDLRKMIDQWMNNPEEDDRNQRLEIMKAYYTFEESGQKLSDDQEGRVLLNQIRKMVSLDIPKEELDQIKENIREELKQKGFSIESAN